MKDPNTLLIEVQDELHTIISRARLAEALLDWAPDQLVHVPIRGALAQQVVDLVASLDKLYDFIEDEREKKPFKDAKTEAAH